MATRRRIRAPVKKSRRPRFPDLVEAGPEVPRSNMRKVLGEIDQLLEGIDDLLDERRAA